ncbi:MAG: orotate phosphoribosyltransferase [Nanoarchaeota archaeon]|nr:orotate phosphoribosyltransferase [Nanoarchaeota archaeon]
MEGDIAQILLETKAVTLQPDTPFTFTSGIKSPIYCDNRLLLSFPEQREKIIDAFLAVLKPLDFDVIAGTATAGIAWAAWLVQELKKPMVYVRRKAKGYGKQNQIEGNLEKGQNVVVIEDLVSTGGSSLGAVDAVRVAGGIVTDCIAIFTYELQIAKDGYQKAQCTLHPLTTFTDVVMLATKTGYITPEQKDLVLSWSKDPDAWRRA